MASWKPSRTWAECDAILTAPGMPYETHQLVINDQVMRAYKHVEPTLRGFFLKRVEQFKDREYLLFEGERYTYAQAFERASHVASTLRDVFGVHKGDRVAIIMRNFPEYVLSFWALVLLGAVPVAVNVWTTDDALVHCLIRTDCKVAIVDPERAGKLSPHLDLIKQKTCLENVIVVRTQDSSHRGPREWPGTISWEQAFTTACPPSGSWEREPDCALEDDCIIFFTSGTTALPKAVLCSCRGFLQNMLSMSMVGMRSILRRGGELPKPGAASNPQRVQLMVAPLFHVAGCTSALMTNTSSGAKLVLMRKWNMEQGLKLIESERVTSFGGVPAITLDILRSPLAGSPASKRLERITMGAAPMPPGMPALVKKAFENAAFLQYYGLTETNLNATGLAGQDQLANPTSCGLPLPICDILIMDQATNVALGPGQIGEVWIRGSNIMKCYYNDPEATENAITRDGWFKTGDLGTVDEEGMLYIKDRVKDMIIRGGENIHCVTLENAVLSHPLVIEAGAVGIPDARMGELPAILISVEPGRSRFTSEAELIDWSKRTLPAMVAPVMIIISEERLERNAAGKIVKAKLRAVAKEEWTRRQDKYMQAKL